LGFENFDILNLKVVSNPHELTIKDICIGNCRVECSVDVLQIIEELLVAVGNRFGECSVNKCFECWKIYDIGVAGSLLLIFVILAVDGFKKHWVVLSSLACG
jgi:hypothetical protein